MKNRIIRVVTPACLGAFVLGLAGCATPEDRYGRSAGRYIDDKAVASEVKDALQEDPLYKFGQVHVAAYRGTVQLSGFALNDAHRQRAGEIASRIPGAVAVENNISIAPENPYPRDLHSRDTDQQRTEEGRQPVRDRQDTSERPITDSPDR
jgi:hypothetical protein